MSMAETLAAAQVLRPASAGDRVLVLDQDRRVEHARGGGPVVTREIVPDGG
jgi:hypothetical protein